MMITGRPNTAVLVALLAALLAAAWAAVPALASTPRNTPATAADLELQEAQMRMFRAMRPRLIIEVTEANVNAYLRDNPDQFDLPEGLQRPRVVFGEGYVEVSALAKLLIIPSRVSVRLTPNIRGGRLELRVVRVSAGWMPLPSAFHGGVADMITGVINQALDFNRVTLSRVEVVGGLVRATATVHPLEHD